MNVYSVDGSNSSNLFKFNYFYLISNIIKFKFELFLLKF